MADRDRMTTSSDRPVPQGMTEAEFTEQQRKEAAQQGVTREEAARRSAAGQRQTADDVQKKAEAQATGQRSAADRLRDPHTPQEQAAQPAETLAQGSQTERSRAEHQQFPTRQVAERDNPTSGVSSFQQQSSAREADVARHTTEQSEFSKGMRDITDPVAAINHHLEAIAVIARDLPNSDELAAFTASLLAAQRQLEDVKTA